MPLSGLETILIPIIVGGAGITAGRIWANNGKVTMERCGLVHKAIDDKLNSIEKKIDKMNNLKKPDESHS